MTNFKGFWGSFLGLMIALSLVFNVAGCSEDEDVDVEGIWSIKIMIEDGVTTNFPNDDIESRVLFLLGGSSSTYIQEVAGDLLHCTDEDSAYTVEGDELTMTDLGEVYTVSRTVNVLELRRTDIDLSMRAELLMDFDTEAAIDVMCDMTNALLGVWKITEAYDAPEDHLYLLPLPFTFDCDYDENADTQIISDLYAEFMNDGIIRGYTKNVVNNINGTCQGLYDPLAGVWYCPQDDGTYMVDEEQITVNITIDEIPYVKNGTITLVGDDITINSDEDDSYVNAIRVDGSEIAGAMELCD
ncbi:MAG: hypothetical protein SVZ03_12370 [Spirochaetota bacterium]|nr:hypothetical protein [Spirochaetota bacterium]